MDKDLYFFAYAHGTQVGTKEEIIEQTFPYERNDKNAVFIPAAQMFPEDETLDVSIDKLLKYTTLGLQKKAWQIQIHGDEITVHVRNASYYLVNQLPEQLERLFGLTLTKTIQTGGRSYVSGGPSSWTGDQIYQIPA